MLYLIAEGPQRQDYWRKRLVEGQQLTLGRSAGTWSVPWDDAISRQHVELSCLRDRLRIRKIGTARNQVFIKGAAREAFSVHLGEHFVIGSTSFTFVNESVELADQNRPLMTELTISADMLRNVVFENDNQRIEALRKIPEAMQGVSDEVTSYGILSQTLFAGIPTAANVGVIRHSLVREITSDSQIIHWDRRSESSEDFQPSPSILKQLAENLESVAHVWNDDVEKEGNSVREQNEWAFCWPLEIQENQVLAIYVSGKFSRHTSSDSAAERLTDDLKYTEVVGATVKSIMEAKKLERQHASLHQFFSPIVVDAISSRNASEVLKPREFDGSVLFCDLRGFTQQSEAASGRLLELLEQVSASLGVMTRCILNEGGVIGDFHGDAAMGFWGWPLDQEDAALRASRAALAIQSEFHSHRLKSSPEAFTDYADMKVGIGIATGRAVAGKIGTRDQVKVTAFGPVVNLASRLEGLTKVTGAPILLDDATAKAIEASDLDLGRVRRVAAVLPYGQQNPVTLTELLASEEQSEIDNQDLENYATALQDFQNGDWEAALRHLHQISPNDRVRDFLSVYIASHGRRPPKDWNGKIEIQSK